MVERRGFGVRGTWLRDVVSEYVVSEWLRDVGRRFSGAGDRLRIPVCHTERMRTGTLIVCCMLLALTLPVRATLIVPADLGELSRDARAIVRGRVAALDAQWTEDRGTIETIVTLEVEHYIKGAFGPTLRFRVPGGDLGRFRSIVVGAPEFAVDERVVPELVQDAFTPDAVAREAISMLTDRDRAARIRAGLATVRSRSAAVGEGRLSRTARVRDPHGAPPALPACPRW